MKVVFELSDDNGRFLGFYRAKSAAAAIKSMMLDCDDDDLWDHVKAIRREDLDHLSDDELID